MLTTPSGFAALGQGRIRSTTARRTPYGLWIQVDVDEPQEIAGLLSHGNRRVSQRLWGELRRIKAAKRDGAGSYVEVAGEFRLGCTHRWMSVFLIGVPLLGHPFLARFRRVLVISGTQRHAGRTWRGPSRRLVETLARVPTGAGPDALWQILSGDDGYDMLRSA